MIIATQVKGLTTLLLQMVNFVTPISVPALYEVNKTITAGLPALLYSYIISK